MQEEEGYKIIVFCSKISAELNQVSRSLPPDIKLDLTISQASGVVRTGRLTAAAQLF